MELPLHHHCQLFTAQNQDVRSLEDVLEKSDLKNIRF